MARKIAEINIKMECGGEITTYLQCKNVKHIQKQLMKKHHNGIFDFGHFTVEDGAVFEATFKLHEVN